MVTGTRAHMALVVWMLLLVVEVQSEVASFSRVEKIDKWHNEHRIIRRKDEAKWMTHAPMYTQQTEMDESEAPHVRFDEDEGKNAWDGSGSTFVDTDEFFDGSREAGDEGSEDEGSKDGLSLDFASELDAQLAEFRKIRSPAAAAIQQRDNELEESNNGEDGSSSPSAQIDELPVIPDDDRYDYSAANPARQSIVVISVAATTVTTALVLLV